jgi:hypothetical protein
MPSGGVPLETKTGVAHAVLPIERARGAGHSVWICATAFGER